MYFWSVLICCLLSERLQHTLGSSCNLDPCVMLGFQRSSVLAPPLVPAPTAHWPAMQVSTRVEVDLQSFTVNLFYNNWKYLRDTSYPLVFPVCNWSVCSRNKFITQPDMKRKTLDSTANWGQWHHWKIFNSQIFILTGTRESAQPIHIQSGVQVFTNLWKYSGSLATLLSAHSRFFSRMPCRSAREAARLMLLWLLRTLKSFLWSSGSISTALCEAWLRARGLSY